ncbi:DUF4959 domain-containing protein [Niabella hibiscisoli]|uniref:DUF4959 domain-containing protein n=1 Tax=Niabella hibiscisoli TaxID=1825928 RepID=UPI001F111764|nr:DUF4959 domain-containing protein [Niabella hibiscisoli]MCH5718272.1 DUF4959 domain-containing protein [Niabella hibiscisoli]
MFTTNNSKLLILFLGILFTLVACQKVSDYNDTVSGDTTKPDPVSNVKVVNFNGGAYITYTLPKSDNILYVQANYKINNTASRQTKSSYYSDSITVSGFAESKEYQVVLRTVSRANVSSDSIVVTVRPDTPPYLLALPTVSMRNDFGGVKIDVVNKLKANIGIITIAQDATTRQLEIVNQNYTNSDSISYSLRGYDTIPKQFGIYVTDQWGNISDTVFSTIKPIYETLIDKSRFSEYRLPSDARTGFGWVMSNLWNGNTGSPGYHTEQPIQPLVWPATITFDIGQSAKLSRYTIWNRGIDGSGNWLWQAGAPSPGYYGVELLRQPTRPYPMQITCLQ